MEEELEIEDQSEVIKKLCNVNNVVINWNDQKLTLNQALNYMDSLEPYESSHPLKYYKRVTEIWIEIGKTLVKNMKLLQEHLKMYHDVLPFKEENIVSEEPTNNESETTKKEDMDVEYPNPKGE